MTSQETAGASKDLLDVIASSKDDALPSKSLLATLGGKKKRRKNWIR